MLVHDRIGIQVPKPQVTAAGAPIIRYGSGRVRLRPRARRHARQPQVTDVGRYRPRRHRFSRWATSELDQVGDLRRRRNRLDCARPGVLWSSI